MNKCLVKLPKALEYQIEDADIQKELLSVEEYIQRIDFGEEECIIVVPLRGSYNDFEKRMNTAIVFVNRLKETISELHCRISFPSDLDDVQIANMTVDFDKNFLGLMGANEAVLAHFNVPVKGLTGDRVFTTRELACSVYDVRVTYEENDYEKNN